MCLRYGEHRVRSGREQQGRLPGGGGISAKLNGEPSSPAGKGRRATQAEGSEEGKRMGFSEPCRYIYSSKNVLFYIGV